MTDPAIQRSASGEALPAEFLRQVAEEVRSAFPRPPSGPELVLIDVDPRRLHAFWTLPPATVEAARRELNPDAEQPMVLRVRQIASNGARTASFDVEVVGLQGQRYVEVEGEGRRYRGELGLRGSDGRLVCLAASAEVELPRLRPANENSGAKTPGVPERATGQAPPPPREPVVHPFPLPPSEASDFVPHHVAPNAGAGETLAARRSAAGELSRDEPAPVSNGERGTMVSPELPGPVQHPFSLPPLEACEFDPEALSRAVPPALEAGHDATVPERAGATPHAAHQNHREAEPAHHAPDPPGVEEASGSEGERCESLPLENVLTLSSYALGRETVLFEINAELHVFGRARPGTQLNLFGRKVPLRPDGTFLVIQPLPSGALVLSSLLVGDDARPPNE